MSLVRRLRLLWRILTMPDATGQLTWRVRLAAMWRTIFMASPFIEKLIQEANDLGRLELISSDAERALSVAEAHYDEADADAAARFAEIQAEYDAALASALSEKTAEEVEVGGGVTMAQKEVDVAQAAADQARDLLEKQKDYIIASVRALAFTEGNDPTPAPVDPPVG